MGWFGKIAVVGAGQAAVRETVGTLLGAIGFGPMSASVVLGAVASIGAWFDGKTWLDITVYGLATLAASLFIIAFVVNFIRALRDVPMSLAIRDRLTFGEIAERWANETRDHPGALSREEILKEVLRAVWLGSFEDRTGNSRLILTAPPVTHLDRDDYGEWDRRTLLSALHPRIQAALPDTELPKRIDLMPQPDSTPKEWSEIRDTIPWERIGDIDLRHYDDNDRSAYIEPLSISKADFRKWLKSTRKRLPDFWFG